MRFETFCEVDLQQERQGQSLEQMMQTKRQKQRKENSIQDTRARTNPILSWVVNIRILLFLYLEPIGQLAQDLSKTGLGSNRCFIEPDVELVDGVFKPLFCILITIQKQIIFISAKWNQCEMQGWILTFISGIYILTVLELIEIMVFIQFVQ